MPKRIQMSRQKPWRADNPDAVIVARPSKWGNPFAIGQKRMVFEDLGWGTVTLRPVGPIASGEVAHVVEVADRSQAVTMFAAWMKSCLESASPPDLEKLRGHDLACWCPPDQPCHADILLELANA